MPKPRSQVLLNVDPNLLAAFDLAAREAATNRSEAIRQAMRLYIDTPLEDRAGLLAD